MHHLNPNQKVFVAVFLGCLCASTVLADAVQDLTAGLKDRSPDVRTQAWQNAGPAGAAAVPAVAELMSSEDGEIARCATEALGQIAYHAGRPGADAECAAVAQALAGLLDMKYSEPVRREALYLLSLVGGDAEATSVALLLQNEALADRACLTLERMPGDVATRALLNALPNVSPATRLRVIASLGTRQDRRIAPALVELAQAGDEAVAWACLEALAHMGIPPTEVAGAVSRQTPEQKRRYVTSLLTAAQACADRGELDMAERLYTSVSTFYVTRDQACGALVGLRSIGSARLIEHALGYLAEPGIYPTAIQVLKEADQDDLNDKLSSAYKVTNPYSKSVILRILAARSAPQLTELLPQAKKDGAPEVRVAAAEVAGDVPNADDLLAVGLNAVPWLREPALHAYIAAAEARIGGDQTEEARIMLEKVVKADVATELRVEALGLLEQVASQESLAVVEPLLKQDALAVAATRVYVAVVAKNPDKSQAIEALTKLADFESESDAVSFAVAQLNELGADTSLIPKRRGFLTKWYLLGPLPNPDNSAFGKDLIPVGRIDLNEAVKVGEMEYRWKETATSSLPAVVDLRALFDPNQHTAAYAYAPVMIPAATAAVLRIGSDDGCEVWVNGAKVHAAGDPRSLIVDQDAVKIDLKQGVNTFLVKVLQGSSDWQLCVRLTDRDGVPIDLTAQP
jgi:hypothetical protein